MGGERFTSNSIRKRIFQISFVILVFGALAYFALFGFRVPEGLAALLLQSWGNFDSASAEHTITMDATDSTSSVWLQDKLATTSPIAEMVIQKPVSESKPKEKKPKLEAVLKNEHKESSISIAVNSSSTCSFVSEAGPDRRMLINEIAWMGSSIAADAEWIELKNISTTSINVSGWELLDQSGKLDVSLDRKTIKSGSFYLLERGDDNSVPGVSADKIYTMRLSNAGGSLRLFDASCTLIDEIIAPEAWPAGNNETKHTLERDVDGFGWHTSTMPGGTPKKENSRILSITLPQIAAESRPTPAILSTTTLTSSGIAVEEASSTDTNTTSTASAVENSSTSSASPDFGHVLIAEIQITGGEGKSDNDFIKIVNPADARIDISGFKLRKRTQSGSDSSIRVFPDGAAIDAGQIFMWANSKNGFSETIGANVSSTQTLTDNSSIAILNSSGTIIDEVAWGSGQVNPYLEIAPYPDNPGENQVLKRKLLDGMWQDTDNNSLDFQIE